LVYKYCKVFAYVKYTSLAREESLLSTFPLLEHCIDSNNVLNSDKKSQRLEIIKLLMHVMVGKIVDLDSLQEDAAQNLLKVVSFCAQRA
jgi:hypothetical protein